MANQIVSEQEWTCARRGLLSSEKELTQLRERVACQRRNLPWHKVKEDYVFSGPEGTSRLSELFEDRSQLIAYHFMFGPEWTEGCKSCSFWADQYDVINAHIGARDVSLAVISRAPWEVFQPFKERMGWQFRWLSSSTNSFNADYSVSFPEQQRASYNYRETGVMEEMPGLSVFTRNDEGQVFHTYSTYARGLDTLNATYQMLDLVPKGRDESGLPFPMSWVRHHDQY